MQKSTATPESLLKKHWGYKKFRPLQKEAVCDLTAGRDSLVLMPTGGGKSLCFQLPALLREGTALVISPLISLMKDQVDSLNDMGIPAARIDSSLTPREYGEARNSLRRGEIKLLYLSPEKVLSPGFPEIADEITVSLIAIDEAHCVSMWGHDFRQEYRKLKTLRKMFPDIPMGAFTATATLQVRKDIAKQLSLRNHAEYIGSFDRPNLTYRILRRDNLEHQLDDVLARHKKESGIIYCISRKDTEKWAAKLSAKGIKIGAYHAGLSDTERRKVQENFIRDKLQVVAATVAFGMGIDKSNIRYVIHTGMPKSLENYQQETGRGGRDGLPCECVLYHSGRDLIIWRTILNNPPADNPAEQKLKAMASYCSSASCRHRALLDYFHEPNEMSDCSSCDVCLGELPAEPDALIIAQKIISCVARLRERFGGEYVAQVLTGSRQQRIIENNHDSLSTWGILEEYSKTEVRNWTEQLVSGGYLERRGEYNVLGITLTGRMVLKGEETPLLIKAKKQTVKSTKLELESWEGIDEELYLKLRDLRRTLADKAGLPAFMVFSDASIRDMARRKPHSREEFLNVHGVGEKKWERYGKEFLSIFE